QLHYLYDKETPQDSCSFTKLPIPKNTYKDAEKENVVQDINCRSFTNNFINIIEKHRTMISQPISLRDLLEAGLSMQVSDKRHLKTSTSN
ncbi:hypothetical protein NQ314_014143, partial [Rhamnusium bicolor]